MRYGFKGTTIDRAQSIMKQPSAIVSILLASLSSGSQGKSCCFLPSVMDRSISSESVGSGRTRITNHLQSSTVRLQRKYHGKEDICSGGRIDHQYNVYHGPRAPNMVVCHMSKNKVQGFFSNKNKEVENIGDDIEEEQPKRGPFKRLREKISTSFNSNKKGEEKQNNNIGEGEKIGYKPNPLDGIRLRLAMAMSSLSNKNLFQFGKQDEWVVACPKTRVGPGQIVPCTVNGLDIIIFASRDGSRLDAFANACPHLGSPFDLATVERKPVLQDRGRTEDDGTGDGCVDCIVCPVHRTAFEIQSGQVRGEWCPYPPIIGNVM